MLVRNKVLSLIRRGAAAREEATRLAQAVRAAARPTLRPGVDERPWEPVYAGGQADLIDRVFSLAFQETLNWAQQLFGECDRMPAEVVLAHATSLEAGFVALVQAFAPYRDALLQRAVPPAARSLAILDRVAADAYVTILQRAHGLGLVDRLSLSLVPLCSLHAAYSPIAYAHKVESRQRALVPVPLIFVSYDRAVSPWDWPLIFHELGHPLLRDLCGGTPALEMEWAAALSQLALQGTNDPSVAGYWSRWSGEVFADVIGVMLGGPAYALALQEALAQPREALAQFHAEDSHPPQVVRVFLCAGVLRSLGFTGEAERLEQRQLAIYGPMPQFDALLAALPTVVMPLTTMSLQALHRRSLVDLVTPFSYSDQRTVETAAHALLEGAVPPAMRPVQVASAARWSFEQITGADQPERLADAAVSALFDARPAAEPARLDDKVLEQLLHQIQPAPQTPAERPEAAQEMPQTIAGALTITKSKAYLDPFPVMGPTGEIVEIENGDSGAALTDLNGRLVYAVGHVRRKDPARSSRLSIRLKQIRDLQTGQLLQVVES
jgi:hypothetical protein